tara:strand:- start:4660 stop:5253 length:594 start_codon:yes stop_codon:yes gene_type:complete
MSQHKRSIKKAKTYLSRSIQKHGWDNFKKEILIDDVPEEDLSNLEKCYIEVENTMRPHGYNLTKGGEGCSGLKHTDETLKKMSQSHTLRHSNRDQFGTLSFDKSHNKYRARGPSPDRKCIGRYFTKEKAEEALNHFNATGECIASDQTIRKRGTGGIKKSNNGKRYVAHYTKNKKIIQKTLDTPEECEEWLNKELNF